MPTLKQWIDESPGPETCPFRGEQLAGEAGWRECDSCGDKTVRLKLFSCPFHAGQGVTYRECRGCHVPALNVPAVPDDAPLVFWCCARNYRGRHSTFFIEPLAAAGLRVQFVELDPKKPAAGLPELSWKHGVPDAIVQWEEHGCGRATKPWRDAVQWAYSRGILPLMADFGYISHYEQFMFDRYAPDGSNHLDWQWADLPETPIDWDAQSYPVRDRRRRVLRGYENARAKPPLIDGKYVTFWLQQQPQLCRLDPHNHWNDLVARVAYEMRSRNLQLVVKTAPRTEDHKALTEWPDDVIVYRHEEADSDINQRLAVHAEYCLVSSSSITNEFVMAGLPVVALGRSWFNGKGIFYEPGAWADLPSAAPEINQTARNRWLHWWMRKQFASKEAGPALWRELDQWRQDWPKGGSAVTCVYAPDRATEQVAAASIEKTAQTFGPWKRIVAIDDASPAFTLWAKGTGAEVIADDDGQPPRMGRLLAAALARTEGEYVWTIEHDAQVDAENADRAMDILQRLPRRVAALVLMSRDSDGNPNYPSTADWPQATPWPDAAAAHLRKAEWPTLNCTVWRRRAFQAINPDRLPVLEMVDATMGNMLAANGYICLMTDLASCVHAPHTGRKSRSGCARTLVINWPGSHLNNRGLRFGWNGSPCDVRGNVPGALPFDDATFRDIYVGDGMDGLTPDQRRLFMIEAGRVLRPGGRLDIKPGDWSRIMPEGFAPIRCSADKSSFRRIEEAADA